MNQLSKKISFIFILLLISCAPNTTEIPVSTSIISSVSTQTKTPIPPEPPTYTPTPQPSFIPVAYALTDLDVPRFSMIQSFPGISSDDLNPPYPVIAAGPDRLILMHDNGAEIRAKNGDLISGSDLIRLFQNEFTDARAVYDWYEEKFIITAWGWDYTPDCQPGECIADIYMAISKNSFPDSFTTDDWNYYRIDGTLQDNKPQAIWPDFVSLGFNEKYIVLTAHRIRFASHEHVGDKIWVLEKDKLGNGGELSNWMEYANLIDPLSGAPATDYQPALHLSQSNTFFIISQTSWNCGVTIWGVDSEGSLNAESVQSPSTCKDAPPAKQPGDFLPLSIGNGPKFHVQPIYNNGMLWATHTIQKVINNNMVSAVRWMEIDVSGWPNDVHIVQEGYIEDENNWVFYPAIMADKNNDMAIVYGKSGESTYPSLMYTGRLVSDPLNTTLPESVVKLGYTSINLPNEDNEVRYGTYFGISLDPTDDTIWVHGEYGGNEYLHKTWVAQFNWEKMIPIISEVGPLDDLSNSSNIGANPSFTVEFDRVLSEDEVDFDVPPGTITVKFLTTNLHLVSLSGEEIRNICKCGDFYSGLTNGGIEDGYEIIFIHFRELKVGENTITFVLNNVEQEVTFTYQP